METSNSDEEMQETTEEARKKENFEFASPLYRLETANQKSENKVSKHSSLTDEELLEATGKTVTEVTTYQKPEQPAQTDADDSVEELEGNDDAVQRVKDVVSKQKPDNDLT